LDAFAVGEAVARGVLVPPGPVGLDRRAFEVADLQFVEAGFDQHGHLAAVQGDADRLLGTQQARAHGQIDVQIGQLRAEGAGLHSSPRGQRDGPGRIAAEHVGGVRRRFCVAREDE
jgi:hypothetical protein